MNSRLFSIPAVRRCAVLPLLLVLTAVMLLPGTAGAKTTAPEKVKISGSHYVAAGLSVRLTASVSPAKADQAVAWSSSNPKVARVNQKGKVTGVAEGTAVITAASGKKPKILKKWKITVTRKAASRVRITAPSKTIDLAGEKKLTLTALALPAKYAAQAFTWSSSDPKIASVSAKGVVTAKAVGKVTVTAAAVDGSGRQVSVTLRVVDTTPPNYYALLIANSKYTGSYHPLKGPPGDIQAWKKLLTGLSQPWKITEKHDLSGRQILSAIPSAFRGATERDVCLLIYAGHGEDGEVPEAGALLGVRYDIDTNGKDYASPAQLANALKKACPGKVFVILESCGSGGAIYGKKKLPWDFSENPGNFTRNVIRAFSGRDEKIQSNVGELRQPKFTVLAACEIANSSIQLPLTKKLEAGIFDYCLITAMGCKYPSGAYNGSTPADRNGDGKITLKELFRAANSVYSDLKTRYDDLDQVFQQYGDPDQVLFIR